MKVAVYIRVSTVSQNLAGQKAAIKRWLKAKGITAKNVQWFEDKKSGDNIERPAFEAMQKAIANGEVQTVIVYKLDRISRKITHGLSVLHDWLGDGIRVVSVTQDFDFSGSTGKLVAALLFGVAEMEQEARRERQQEGIEEAKRKGVYKKNGERREGHRKITPKLVANLYHQENMSAAKIAADLRIGRSTVYKYLGEVANS